MYIIFIFEQYFAGDHLEKITLQKQFFKCLPCIIRNCTVIESAKDKFFCKRRQIQSQKGDCLKKKKPEDRKCDDTVTLER
jgi:hypothetical protein